MSASREGERKHIYRASRKRNAERPDEAAAHHHLPSFCECSGRTSSLLPRGLPANGRTTALDCGISRSVKPSPKLRLWKKQAAYCARPNPFSQPQQPYGKWQSRKKRQSVMLERQSMEWLAAVCLPGNRDVPGAGCCLGWAPIPV